jgi:glycosyltransferase involved in cell wall biosynthesis
VNSSDPLVSVVTPAYNEESYLAECIESVLAQTYTNWDYTIINNGSTDGTLAIAEKYAAKDPRIRVISNDACIPALANFNLALRQISSTSKYCKMVLADDTMLPECLDRMVALMEAHPSIGITGAYGISTRWVVWHGLPYPNAMFSGREICRQRLMGGPYVFGSQSSVLYRADLVRSHDPFYNETNVHADSEACFELLKECDFGFVYQVLTYSRDDRPGGMLGTARDLNSIAAGMLHELVTYGPFYLSQSEFKSCMNVTLTKYYDYLCRGLLDRRNKHFWDYHKKKLQEEGIEFQYSRLAYHLAKRIMGKFRRKQLQPQLGL